MQTGVDPLAALGLTPATRTETNPGAQELLAAGAQAAVIPAAAARWTCRLSRRCSANTQRQGRTYSGNPVSLDFQQADLRAVLRVFAEISGLNIVIDPAVRGTVDVALRDVPWDQALDIILRANKLGYIVDGTVVRIAPLTRSPTKRTSGANSPTSRRWPAICAC